MDKNCSNDFSRFLGSKTEDDWFDYRLEHDPRFLVRIERARQAFRAGQGIRLEDIKWDEEKNE